MKKSFPVIIVVLVILAGASGLVLYKTVFAPKPAPQVTEQAPSETLPTVDASVQVSILKSTAQANAVTLSVKGIAGKMKTIEYELTYDSRGITQGAMARPIDVSGKDTFERDIYLGTCSKNVCTPHLGVTKVSLTLVFTDVSGKKSQFSKDYPL